MCVNAIYFTPPEKHAMKKSQSSVTLIGRVFSFSFYYFAVTSAAAVNAWYLFCFVFDALPLCVRASVYMFVFAYT